MTWSPSVQLARGFISGALLPPQCLHLLQTRNLVLLLASPAAAGALLCEVFLPDPRAPPTDQDGRGTAVVRLFVLFQSGYSV
jgi:hypothetical protein